jgi:hypothetical protein
VAQLSASGSSRRGDFTHCSGPACANPYKQDHGRLIHLGIAQITT